MITDPLAQRRANATCPLCDHPIVIAPTGALIGRNVMFSPATREEKIAACPKHGRSPYNHASIRAENSR